MAKEGRSYPNPDPKHPISARLEHVRTRNGFGSKRAFYRKLCDGWEDAVSYEAVRNYHYDREPPPSYLARVAEVFDVRLAWLVAGEGEVTKAEQEAARAVEIGALPGPLHLPVDTPTKNALVAAWGTVMEAHGGEPGAVEGGVGPTVSGKAWTTLQGAVKAPLASLQDYVVMVEGEALSDFVTEVAFAIRRYVRDAPRPPSQGD